MISIQQTQDKFQQNQIDKPTFIKTMYKEHHAALFDYANYLSRTNIKKIEIEDGSVIMTSRDRGIRIACTPGDYRVAPIETLNFFDYEKEESQMMENLIADGDVFFDIGANIGWYSINIAASRRASTIYAFEQVYLGKKTVEDIDWLKKIIESKLSTELLEKVKLTSDKITDKTDLKSIGKIISELFGATSK